MSADFIQSGHRILVQIGGWGVIIGEEKVAAVSRLFFFSFVATFDNFCPSVRPFSVLFSDKRHHFSALFG